MRFKNSLSRWEHKLPWRSMGRWWLVGLAFYAVGLGILYLIIDVLRTPLIWGTLCTAEFTILLRFAINDRWVFGHRRPTLIRLWQFHLASAGGGVVWWVVANALPRLGVHYLIASTAGTACSVLFSMLTNFLWIWRPNASKAVAAPSGANCEETSPRH